MKSGLIFVALVGVVASSLWVRELSEEDVSRALLHIAILMGISLFFLVPGLRRAQHTIALLRDGKPGLAKAAEVTESTSEDYGRLVHLTFVFIAPDGSENKREVRLPRSASDRVTDDAEEPCLYDAKDFSRFVVLDEIPGEVRVVENGGLETDLPRGEPWTIFIVPAVYYVVGMFLYPWVQVLGI